MKFIFLDIDGVLNSTTDFLEVKYYGHPNNSNGEVIAPGKLALLEEIIKQTDAKIVLSSTWREIFSIKEIHEMFAARGFTLPINVFAGKTDSSGFSLDGTRELYGRSTRIQEWMDYKGRNIVDAYVIIDDMEERYLEDLHKGHIVTTDFHDGLNFYAAEKAINILGRNKEYQEKQDELDKDLELLAGLMI
jgi:hypothetical protein